MKPITIALNAVEQARACMAPFDMILRLETILNNLRVFGTVGQPVIEFVVTEPDMEEVE